MMPYTIQKCTFPPDLKKLKINLTEIPQDRRQLPTT